ncbi:MAG: phosphotransferase [Nitrolancea sp.]
MSSAEVEHVSRALPAICLQAYPEFGSQKIDGLERISDGWECDVYRFNLEGVEQADHVQRALILRVYLGYGAAAKAEWEFRVMQTLRSLGYPVPRVDAVLTDSALGSPLMLMERVDGSILGLKMVRAANDAELGTWLVLFCRLLVDLHRLDWRPFVPNPDDYASEEAATRWCTGMRKWIQRLGFNEFGEAFDWLEREAPRVAPGRLSVVHWDFHPWNVLLRPDGAPAVIDWTSAEVTDSRFDLAWTLLLVSANSGHDAREAVLAGYEREAGEPVKDLAYFEAAACLRRIASMVISLAAGSEVFGMRAGAEVQMRENLTHLSTAYALFQERTGLRLPIAEAELSR